MPNQIAAEEPDRISSVTRGQGNWPSDPPATGIIWGENCS